MARRGVRARQVLVLRARAFSRAHLSPGELLRVPGAASYVLACAANWSWQAAFVARLKEPPFGGARYASLTGPSLSELGPDATRELCFDAFAAIVPAWGDDARDARGHHGGEDPLLDFLRHAKYAPPPSTDALTMLA